jgi:hypothetical protein
MDFLTVMMKTSLVVGGHVQGGVVRSYSSSSLSRVAIAIQSCSLVVITCFILVWAAPRPAAAQATCAGLTVRDDTSATLDDDALCAAAEPWIEQGVQVYVFVTDEDPSSEDAWFAIRDEVEGGWGIYNPANQTFARSALAVELTTVTSHPWGQDIAFGERLFGTPLDDDTAVARLEGRLKNGVAEGDGSAAIVDALSAAYTTAYPDAVPVPTVQSGTNAGGGTTNTNEGAETNTGNGWFGGIVAAIAAAIAAVAATPTLIMPALRRRRERARLEAHLQRLSDTVGGLLYAAKTLFTGETPTETTLWKLFLVYGGDRYADLAADVRAWTEQSMKALGEVLVLHEDMDHRTPGKNPEDITAMIRAYEIMYLTLVGTNPAILEAI